MSFASLFGRWGQQASQALGNAVSGVGQVFNPIYAKQYYAQQANQAFQSGSWGWVGASAWDAAGGFVAMGTGSPQSPGQALWSMALSTPVIGAKGALGAVTTGVQFGASFSSAINSSVSAIASHTPMGMPDFASSMIGFVGSGLTAASEALGVIPTKVASSGQYFFSFPSQQALNAGKIMSAASDGLSAGGFMDSIWQTSSGLGREVGGILFENCDAVLTGIAEITGAYWDPATQSLVLIGKSDLNGKALPFVLPAMDADHLRVALRAALAGQPLGVSINPPANYRYGDRSKEMLPDGLPFVVSYLGETAGTLYGAIMFEADRLMKCLSIGKHNQTRNSFSANVPGYQDLFQMPWGNGAGSNHSWHRFWINIDRVEIKKSPQSQAFSFGQVRLKVLNELELAGSPKGQVIDPNDQAFCKHLTDNYDAYAKEFPVFARLKELAKIAAIAKYLVNQKVLLDVGSLFATPAVQVTTPETTPSIVRSESTTEGNTIHHRQMSGGVDMDQDPVVVADASGVTDRMQTSAATARPPSASDWQFQSGGVALGAKAVPMGSPTPFRRLVVDHQFPPVNGQPPLTLKRVYDSSKLHAGQFGPGWCLFVPFSLTVMQPSGKRQEVLSAEELAQHKQESNLILLHDRTAGTAVFYRAVSKTQNGAPSQYARVTSQTATKGSVSFQYDPGDTIQKQGNQFQLPRSGLNYFFDGNGRLIEIRSGAVCQAKYIWEKERVVRLENGGGQSYTFEYETPDAGRVAAVNISGGQELQYGYDLNACLREVKQGQMIKERYGYNLDGLLALVRDANDVVTARANYDAMGRLHAAVSEKISLPGGGSVTRNLSSGRLSAMVDDRGARADFVYGSKGQLTDIAIKNRNGHTWRLEYAPNGSLGRVVDPVNHGNELVNDSHGLVAKAILPDKRSWSAKRDSAGRLLEIKVPCGEPWVPVFEADGRLTGFSGPQKRAGASETLSSGGVCTMKKLGAAGCEYACGGKKLTLTQVVDAVALDSDAGQEEIRSTVNSDSIMHLSFK